MLFGEVSAYIPQVVVISTSLGTFPRPVPRPLPGVTLPASPECPSPLYWGWLWGGYRVARWWTTSVSMACSTRVFEVVVVAAGRGEGCPGGLFMAVVRVGGVGFGGVRGCGYVQWPRTGSIRWPSLWSMVCSTRVFDVVGVVAGRGVGRFAGRSCCRRCGLRWCSRVFDGVGVLAGRGVGRVAGRLWCRWSGLRWCSRVWACLLAVVEVVSVAWLMDDFCVFTGVGGLVGRRLGRLGRLGWKLVDDFCGAGVGLLSVRGCGRGCWPSSRSSRCLRVVASGVGEASLGCVRLRLGGVRLRSRLWVVGVTRKDV